MYITNVKTKRKDGGVSYECVLLRESYREDGKVKSRTIANLTHLDPKEIAAMRLALKHKENLAELGSLEEIEIKEGKSFGAIWLVYRIAKDLGIETVLGSTRPGKLALWQVIARVIDQGSRLSAVRLAEGTAACDVLGMTKGFSEDDLYDNLKYLANNQDEIEKKLFATLPEKSGSNLFLYDVTSSYFEGSANEMSAYGYNRDGKKNKKQVVLGLLCDESGCPVSVRVYEGATRDFNTVSDQIEKVRKDFGIEEITFVGDRGMIKGPQIKELESYGLNYVTAITKPQIVALIKGGVIQMSLFDSKISEIEHEGVRYVLRRNPVRAKDMAVTRDEKAASVQELLDKKNTYLVEHKKAHVEVALKKVEAKIKKLRVGAWLSATAVDRKIELKVDKEALTKITAFDGCYCLKTNLSKEAAAAQVVHDRYKDLAEVEEAFRTQKTAHLEMRPWYVVTENSTRGHALVVMLSYMIVRRLKDAWNHLDITVEEGLKQLGTLCTQKISVNGCELHKIPTPRDASAAFLKAAGVALPEVLPELGARVVSRKKLTSRRKLASSSS